MAPEAPTMGMAEAGETCSELQTIQSNPQVGLIALPGVEAFLAARKHHRRSPPEGWLPRELVPKLLGDPDLAGLDVRLDPRRTEHGLAAGHCRGPVTLALASQHLTVMQRDP